METIRTEMVLNEADVLDEAKRIIEVTIIKPGLSKAITWSGARINYPTEALEASLPLWSGATAFCDHYNKSVRNIAGVYFSPWYDEGVRARLRFTDEGLYHLVHQVITDREAGLPVPDIGISADIIINGDFLEKEDSDKEDSESESESESESKSESEVFQVSEITDVISADIVFSPAAGGSFDRVLNAVRAKLAKSETKSESESQSIKRIRDLQSIADKLRLQVRNQEEQIESLSHELEDAVSRYREDILRSNPEIPPDLLTGQTISELDSSLGKAQELFEKVRQYAEAQVPAGSPPRAGVDFDAMSPIDKIKHGLSKK